MLDFIVQYWIEILFGAMLTCITYLVRLVFKRIKENDQKQTAIEKGVQALLRDRIVKAYYHYVEKGYITLHGLENVRRMSQEYFALGGNGCIAKLVDDMEKMDVRD